METSLRHIINQLIKSHILLISLIFFQGCTSEEKMRNQPVGKRNHFHNTTDSLNLNEGIYAINNGIIADQKTVKPVVKEAGEVIRLNGIIAPDATRNKVISARAGGRIEKLFVKYNYQFIKKGEKILELYSPELRSVQEEYIYLLDNSGDGKLVEFAKKKLSLLGLTTHQIKELESRRKIFTNINFYSPHSGFVLLNPSRPGGNISNEKNGDEMKMGASSGNKETSLAAEMTTTNELREGGYIQKEQTLFAINDLEKVWVFLSIDPASQNIIKTNTPVTITPENLPEEPIEAKIDLLEPVFIEGVKFLQARVYLNNQERKFKVNSLVSASMQIKSDLMVIPNTSIADLGTRKIVWIKTQELSTGKKVFEPRAIITGARNKGGTVIISGLKRDDEIAEDAGYLSGSEAVIP